MRSCTLSSKFLILSKCCSFSNDVSARMPFNFYFSRCTCNSNSSSCSSLYFLPLATSYSRLFILLFNSLMFYPYFCIIVFRFLIASTCKLESLSSGKDIKVNFRFSSSLPISSISCSIAEYVIALYYSNSLFSSLKLFWRAEFEFSWSDDFRFASSISDFSWSIRLVEASIFALCPLFYYLSPSESSLR